MKTVLLGVSVLAVLAGTFMPVSAADAVKLDKVAPAADLAKEAEAKIALLETALASNDSYLGAKKTGIPNDAGILALLSQALGEYTDKGGFKGSAPDMRDGAMKLVKASSYDEAKAALAAVKDAAGGKASGAKVAMEWNKVVSLGTVMSEVNKRNGKLRKASRTLPADTAEACRDASVMAILALAAAADTHEVKNPKDVPAWKQMAMDMQASMTDMSSAMKEKSAEKTKAAFMKATTSCADCHKKFRDTEP